MIITELPLVGKTPQISQPSLYKYRSISCRAKYCLKKPFYYAFTSKIFTFKKYVSKYNISENDYLVVKNSSGRYYLVKYYIRKYPKGNNRRRILFSSSIK